MNTPGGIDAPNKARAVLARVFGDGENPLAWGLPIGRIAGVRVRVHLVFLLFVLGVLIFTLPGNRMGLVFALPMLVSLCVLVAAHEMGHVIVCRRLGGRADEVMLWPLGGLTDVHPPQTPSAVLRTALGGLFVNAALVPIFAAAVYFASGSFRSLIFNPLSIGTAVGEVQLRSGTTPWWLVAVWSMYAVNLILLGANLLIPMFPLDAGSLLQAMIWKSMGQMKALWISVHVGMIAAVGLGFVGAMMDDGKVLLAIGVFGGLVCVGKRRQLQFLKYAEMIPGYHTDPQPNTPLASVEPDQGLKGEEIDGILAKISSEGISSISKSDRLKLKRATEISRNSEDNGSVSE